MKFFYYLTTICLLVAAFGSIQADSPIDSLIRAALEVVRKLLKENEPYPVPDMPEQNIHGDEIDLTAKFQDVKVSQADDFIIDHIENSLLGLWAKFGVTVPKMHLEGNYKVHGSVNGKSVNGEGPFQLDITQLVTNGYTELEFSGFYLQMKKLDISYTILNVQFTEDGLSVEGLSPEEVQEMFSNSLLKYFQDNESFVSSQVSEYVKQQSNDIMHGKNLQQLLDWLKKFIGELV